MKRKIRITKKANSIRVPGRRSVVQYSYRDLSEVRKQEKAKQQLQSMRKGSYYTVENNKSAAGIKYTKIMSREKMQAKALRAMQVGVGGI